MAYVENVAAFLEFAMSFKAGVHIYNYIDKPDFSMNQLVGTVRRILGRPEKIAFRLPYVIGLVIGQLFDFFALTTGKRLAISSIRVKKFCSNSMFSTTVTQTGFTAPVPLVKALERTVRHEFVEFHSDETVFYSE